MYIDRIRTRYKLETNTTNIHVCISFTTAYKCGATAALSSGSTSWFRTCIPFTKPTPLLVLSRQTVKFAHVFYEPVRNDDVFPSFFLMNLHDFSPITYDYYCFWKI